MRVARRLRRPGILGNGRMGPGSGRGPWTRRFVRRIGALRIERAGTAPAEGRKERLLRVLLHVARSVEHDALRGKRQGECGYEKPTGETLQKKSFPSRRRDKTVGGPSGPFDHSSRSTGRSYSDVVASARWRPVRPMRSHYVKKRGGEISLSPIRDLTDKNFAHSCNTLVGGKCVTESQIRDLLARCALFRQGKACERKGPAL